MICSTAIEKSSKEIGNAGEQKASEFLKKKGYSILTCNWRNKRGEIDIIALMGETLVFAEVKTVPHSNLETLEYILGTIKQKKIIKTAKCFIQDNRQYSKSYIRFDVLIVDMPCYSPVYHIKNAFSEFV